MAGWQFKAVTGAAMAGKDELAAFFGRFNFYAGLLAFVLQWVLTGRLLRRRGLGFALFIVPVACCSDGWALVSASLAAVIALRGIDQVLQVFDRQADGRAPVSPGALRSHRRREIVHRHRCLADGRRAGRGHGPHCGWLWPGAVVQVAWVNLLLIGGWLAAAYIAQRLYVENLQDSIHHYRLDAERASATGLDRKATDLLPRSLAAAIRRKCCMRCACWTPEPPTTQRIPPSAA